MTMTDNELLLAISGMMDKKLQSELLPIKNDMKAVKDDVQIMRGDLQSTQEEVRMIRSDLQSTQEEVRMIRSGLQSTQEEVQTMKNDLQSTKAEVHQIKLYQENIILPRLETMESCYVDTYKRYKNYADKMEAVFVDVEILKKVVTEHSEKLQQIS